MVNKKTGGQPKAPKAKKTPAKPSSQSSMNPTRKIIDALKKKYEFRLNKANQKMECRLVGKGNYKDLNDNTLNSIKVELNLKDITCSRETLRGIIFSNQWPEYDPYLDFLNNLPKWDGHDYIADLAATVKTDNDKYWYWCF